MKKLIPNLLICLLFIPLVSNGQSLVGVYQQALQSDPTYQQAKGVWLSSSEDIPISRATFLPSFDLTGGVSRSKSEAAATSATYATTSKYGLSVTQALFNQQNWFAIAQAKSSVKSAAATYSAAEQDLIIRVATDYFNVLKASNDLRVTRAAKRAIAKQLEQVRQQYKVGLKAITEVYTVQASYDGAVASEITARNKLANSLEDLRAITGVSYHTLDGIKGSLPLLTPDPENIDEWVKTARRQNYDLIAARYAALAAQKNVAAQAAARYPTLSATGEYDYENQNLGASSKKASRTTTMGLSVDFPVYTGGLITATTKKAQFEYNTADAKMEETYRATVNQTRQAYLGVIAGISKIRADKELIISNASSVKATYAGYIVGTQTIIDFLGLQQKLYNAQKTYAEDQYGYLLNILELKRAAGTLKLEDLNKMAQWLSKPVSVASVKAKTSHPSKNQSIKQQTARKMNHAYAVQLASFPSRHLAQQFIHRNHLKNAKIRKFTRNYRVQLVGYRTMKSAQQVLDGLSVKLKRLKPFVLRVS